jgi:putative transposase
MHDRILIWHEGQLRAVLKHYVTHYNTRRPHRSRDQRPPAPPPQPPKPTNLNHARIHRRKILGGLINEYDAA